MSQTVENFYKSLYEPKLMEYCLGASSQKLPQEILVKSTSNCGANSNTAPPCTQKTRGLFGL